MKKEHDDEKISVLAKVMIFFKTVWDRIAALRLPERFMMRQMKLSSYKGADSSEEAKISYFLGYSRVILVLLLVFLIILTLVFGGSATSYDKVYYMIKDISYVRSFSERAPEYLNYSKPLRSQSFSSFKNGLAVASDSELKLFTSTGRVTLTGGTEMSNPKMCASDGYLLVYDQGRKGFAIYNSFVKLYSEKLKFNISGADISDNGVFLIVTSSEEYASVVKVYNNDFSPLCEYKKNDYVVSAKLSSDGRYAAVLSLSAENGESITTLNVIDCKRNKKISSKKFKGSMPYRCDFLTDGRICVFLDEAVYVLNRNCDVKGSFEYLSAPEKIDVYKDGFAIVFSESENGEKIVSVFDSECRMKRAGRVSGNVYDMKLSDGYVYILQNGKLVRCGTSIGLTDSVSVSDGTTSLVVFKNGEIAACTQSTATYISFD